MRKERSRRPFRLRRRRRGTSREEEYPRGGGGGKAADSSDDERTLLPPRGTSSGAWSDPEKHLREMGEAFFWPPPSNSSPGREDEGP